MSCIGGGGVGGGGQQVHIYFHKQTKDAHTLTLDESIFLGCLQSEPTYLYVLMSAVAC